METMLAEIRHLPVLLEIARKHGAPQWNSYDEKQFRWYFKTGIDFFHVLLEEGKPIGISHSVYLPGLKAYCFHRAAIIHGKRGSGKSVYLLRSAMRHAFLETDATLFKTFPAGDGLAKLAGKEGMTVGQLTEFDSDPVATITRDQYLRLKRKG